jgi:hypothetical protein
MTTTATPHVLIQREELMANTLVSDPVDRVRSYRLSAEAFDRALR